MNSIPNNEDKFLTIQKVVREMLVLEACANSLINVGLADLAGPLMARYHEGRLFLDLVEGK